MRGERPANDRKIPAELEARPAIFQKVLKNRGVQPKENGARPKKLQKRPVEGMERPETL